MEEVKIEVKAEEVKAEEVKTEEVKTEEVKTEEVKTEEVKSEEVKSEEVKSEEVKSEDSNDDIFITENDRFSIKIKYYLNEKKDPQIEGFDDDFDDKKEDMEPQSIHSFEIVFKYPSQRDSEIIMSARPVKNIEETQLTDFIELENIRLMTLLRSWSINRPLSDLSTVHPKIIKAIRANLTNEIGSNGLF